jgi:hypothetical protein
MSRRVMRIMLAFLDMSVLLTLQGKFMESVVLRFLKDVASDPDTDVRCRVAEVLVQLLSQSSSDCGTLFLVVINSILQKGLQVASRAMEKVSGYG